jgi:uncharacterized membrane-anchored protein YhcB (DUF1043 family)
MDFKSAMAFVMANEWTKYLLTFVAGVVVGAVLF